MRRNYLVVRTASILMAQIQTETLHVLDCWPPLPHSLERPAQWLRMGLEATTVAGLEYSERNLEKAQPAQHPILTTEDTVSIQ